MITCGTRLDTDCCWGCEHPFPVVSVSLRSGEEGFNLTTPLCLSVERSGSCAQKMHDHNLVRSNSTTLTAALDLGQFDSGQGQSAFLRLRPEKILWILGQSGQRWGPEGGARKLGGRMVCLKGGGPHSQRVRAPKSGASRGPKFRAFFSLLSPTFSFLFSRFLVFGSAGALKCARLEFSGCHVKPRRPRSRRGFTRQPESPNRAHLRVPVFTKTKIPRENPPEKEERMKIVAGEGKKKERKFGRSGGGRGSTHNTQHTHSRHTQELGHWPKSKLLRHVLTCNTDEQHRV